jgi:hypothetical protein
MSMLVQNIFAQGKTAATRPFPAKTVREFAPIMRGLRWLLGMDVKLHGASDDLHIVQQYPKVVWAVEHGSVHAPPPVIAALYDQWLKARGGDRVPLIVAFRTFYKIPVLRYFISTLTQTFDGLDVHQLLHQMQSGPYSDLIVMPEGAASVFTNGTSVAPFISPKLVEIAVALHAPLMLVVHNGTERLAHSVRIPTWLLPLAQLLPRPLDQAVRETRVVATPRIFIPRLGTVHLMVKEYWPTLQKPQLSLPEPERSALITQEAERVRQRMNEMKRTLTQP